jgi:hypothetical protein
MNDLATRSVRRKREKGQSLVEFALVLPLFLLVLFIIADFGVGFSRWLVITNASREGARLGTVGATTAEVQDRAIRTSHGLLDSSGVTVEYADLDGEPGIGAGDAIVVNAEYRYGFITPIGQVLETLAGGLTLRSCADMRMEDEVTTGATAGAEC